MKDARTGVLGRYGKCNLPSASDIPEKLLIGN